LIDVFDLIFKISMFQRSNVKSFCHKKQDKNIRTFEQFGLIFYKIGHNHAKSLQITDACRLEKPLSARDNYVASNQLKAFLQICRRKR